MSNINELMQDAGVEDLGIGKEGIQNTGPSFYEHLVGDYTALVGKLVVTHVDKEGKKCKPDDSAREKVGSVRLQLMIVKDPEMLLVSQSMEFTEDIPYGRLIFNQFVALDPNKQWSNVWAFSDFTANGQPDAAVIQGKKNEEQVFVNNLQLFYGCPCTFKVEAGTKKEGSRFITKQTLLLADHSTLNKELIRKRKTIADSLNNKLQLHLDEQQKKKKDNKKTEPTEPHAPVESSFLDTAGFTS